MTLDDTITIACVDYVVAGRVTAGLGGDHCRSHAQAGRPCSSSIHKVSGRLERVPGQALSADATSLAWCACSGVPIIIFRSAEILAASSEWRALDRNLEQITDQKQQKADTCLTGSCQQQQNKNTGSL